MNDNAFWNQDWMRVQQQYWEGWSEMSRRAFGLEAPPKNPWEMALDHWWDALRPNAPDLAQGFMNKMMNQGKGVFRMAEEFAQNFQGGENWVEALNKTFGELRNAFTDAAQAGGEDAMHRMAAFWEMPLDNWQRMASSMSIAPGDFLRDMPHMDPSAQMRQFLSAPGLGYTREQQGAQQRLMRRLLDYQQALQDYSKFFSNLGVLAVERMRQKVEARAAADKPLDSARALYDLWVSACEEVYGEQVITGEYTQLHGRLVNSLMAVKRQMGNLVEEVQGALNMPTRTEIRTLQCRLQEVRRENKALRAQLEALSERIDALASQTLKNEVAVTTAAEKSAAPPPPAVTKKAAKKVAKKAAASKKAASRRA